MSVGVLFWVERQPASAQLINAPWDKLVHATVYAVLSTLFWGGLKTRKLWPILIGMAFLGIAQEWHQAYLPGRTPSALDWLADVMGSGMALIILSWRR